MIYLKKIDGTIEQHPDELRPLIEVDIRVQGESFGTLYTADSLPDEDKISLGLTTEAEIFEKKRTAKLQEIVSAFDNELSNGKFLSQALGIEVDCRRSSNKNDKQNVEGLINHMVRNSITEITYVGYDSVKENVTKMMLENLVGEMEDYALGLYNKKWQLETAVKQAKTVGELENIKW
jgi:hypothetical protein